MQTTFLLDLEAQRGITCICLFTSASKLKKITPLGMHHRFSLYIIQYVMKLFLKLG